MNVRNDRKRPSKPHVNSCEYITFWLRPNGFVMEYLKIDAFGLKQKRLTISICCLLYPLLSQHFKRIARGKKSQPVIKYLNSQLSKYLALVPNWSKQTVMISFHNQCWCVRIWVRVSHNHIEDKNTVKTNIMLAHTHTRQIWPN